MFGWTDASASAHNDSPLWKEVAGLLGLSYVWFFTFACLTYWLQSVYWHLLNPLTLG